MNQKKVTIVISPRDRFSGLSGCIDRVIRSLKRRISPIWDQIRNPNEVSTLLYDRLEGNKAVPLSHDIKL